MQEVSKEYEKLVGLSEQNNPYAKECPNRHLWSEGFRSGYNNAKDKVMGLFAFSEGAKWVIPQPEGKEELREELIGFYEFIFTHSPDNWLAKKKVDEYLKSRKVSNH
jgi:hypothetical protein